MDDYPEIRINQDLLAYNEVELMLPAVICLAKQPS
jgi:hypothetical protein